MTQVDYKNGRKNHWRRTLWNRIADMTPNRRDARVLYLPGPKDLDRDEALRRGFLDANLIAVERDPKIAANLRAHGRTVIVGDLEAVLFSLPESFKVDVLVADLMGPLNRTATKIALATLYSPALMGATVAFNMLRGREDRHAAQWLKWTPAYSPELESLLIGTSVQQATGMRAVRGKHRGCRLLYFLAAHELMPLLDRGPDAVGTWVSCVCEGRKAELLDGYLSTSGQVFDAVVYRWPAIQARKSIWNSVQDECLKKRKKSLRRSIVACSAISTMRRSGAIGGSRQIRA